MITIKNVAACNKAMARAWADWHCNTPDDLKPKNPNISFEKGFRYSWMIVERLCNVLEVDEEALMETVNIVFSNESYFK